MKIVRSIGLLVALTSLMFSACAEDTDPVAEELDNTVKPEETASEGGKADAWNWRNDPERFDGEMIYDFEDLPTEGRSETDAWPSTYWPTYEDSIQVRWDGQDELSPAEKYDRAFNGWTPGEDFASLRPFDSSNCTAEFDSEYYEQLGPLATHISRYMGNWRSHDGVDSDDDEAIDECDGDSHDGLETWFGLCHAWVPAAMLEARPERSVTYNGVTFHTADMEGLLIAAYNRSGADMIGGRCNAGTGEDNEVERDDQGRPVDVECRDTNPGSLHIIMTNYLGLAHRPYAEDRTFDYQVWNQPVVAYEITKQDEITAIQANELLEIEGEEYTFNDDAERFLEVHANTTYITESSASRTPADSSQHERTDYYTYVLELDADGNILGGEYFGNSQDHHPDFLWNPRRITQSAVPNLDIEQVRMLVQMSREPVVPPPADDVVTIVGQGDADIPDDDTTGVSVTANVTDPLLIAGLQVEINIQHTYIGDLEVTLSHDDVVRVIHNNTGGSSDNIETTLSVQGFEEYDAQGEWTLTVVDSAGQDVGSIVSWSLLITPGEGIPPVSDAETFPGEGGMDIPDNNTGGIVSAAVVPAGVTGTVQVAVNITHTWRGDLLVELEAGDQTWVLQDKEGGSADDLITTFTLDPQPEGNLAGTWNLWVSDHAGADTGTLNSWSLTITP